MLPDLDSIGVRVSQAGMRYVGERYKRHEFAATTRPNIVSYLLRFSEFVDDRRISKVRRSHVEKYLASLNIAPATMRVRISILRTFFEWCVDRQLMARNPCKGMKPPRIGRSLPRGLEHDAVGKVFQAVPDARSELIVSLMVQEGLRCCEVSRLEVGDINFAERVMLVNGKGSKQRVLPITDETWEALRNYGRPSGGRLIRSYQYPARGITPDRIGKIVVQLMDEAGIKSAKRDGVSAHALRHTCATDMLKGGADLLDVKEVLGHSSISITEIYLPWTVRGMADAMAGRSYRVPVSDPL